MRRNKSVVRDDLDEDWCECAECQSTKFLDEDPSNPGTFYCRDCWAEYEASYGGGGGGGDGAGGVGDSRPRGASAADDPAGGGLDSVLVTKVRSVVGDSFTVSQVEAALLATSLNADRAVISLLGEAAPGATNPSASDPGLDRAAPASKGTAAPAAPARVLSLRSVSAGAAAMSSPKANTPKAKASPKAAASDTPKLKAAVATPSAAQAPGGSARKGTPRKLPPPKRPADDGKTDLNMVVIGHVDAGKSTLMGHLLFKLGNIGKATMHKLEKESASIGKGSFKFAWVMDSDAEERSRGVTVEVGVTRFETRTRRVTLLDAPGHRDFVPKMIAGASQADVAVLVVSAVPSEFDAGFSRGGQTKEHALLVFSLGVKQIVVAVNKMDTATVGWSEEQYNKIRAQVQPFLRGVGFVPANIRFVPVSGLSGINIVPQVAAAAQAADAVALPEELAAWYSGPSLAAAIDAFKPPPRHLDKPLRLCVSDVFRAAMLGDAASGKIETGHVQVGEDVQIMPSGDIVRVKGIQRAGVPVDAAFAGDYVALGLTGLEQGALSRGQIICAPDAPASATPHIRVQIALTGAAKVPMIKGQQLQLHVHTCEYPMFVSKLVALTSRDGEVVQKKPRCLAGTSSAIIELATADERPICIELFTAFRKLGRFLLRDRGVTIAFGIVKKNLSYKPVKRKK